MPQQKKFSLFRITYWRPNDQTVRYQYIIASDWGSAFNNAFSALGEDISISCIELIANENIDLYIDFDYVISNTSNDKSTINNIPVY